MDGAIHPLLDQAVQHLMALRPPANEHGILQYFAFRREVLQQVLAQQGGLVISGEPR